MNAAAIPSSFDPSQDPSEVDVAIVGGGAAGLSAALQLSRQGRSVLVLDAGEPRNAPAAHLHGYLGLDGLEPLELLRRGRAEVISYGGLIRAAEVVGARSEGEGHALRITLELAGGAAVQARAVVLAAGLRDVLPELPGLAERWGKDVLHCPYCHGWEVRGQRIGILATGANATHQALLFGRLGREATLIKHGVELHESDRALLRAAGVRIVEGPAARVIQHDDALRGVELSDGSVVELDALVVQTRMEARLGGLEALGVRAVEHPSGLGTSVQAGLAGASEVDGVWVAGNVSEPAAQLGAAAAAGAQAGAGVNAALAMNEANAALNAQVGA